MSKLSHLVAAMVRASIITSSLNLGRTLRLLVYGHEFQRDLLHSSLFTQNIRARFTLCLRFKGNYSNLTFLLQITWM